MSHTLQRECTVVLFFKGIGYRFDALSNFQFSQTFATNTTVRKTLHSKINKPVNIVTSRNSASFTMEVVGTNTYSEGVFYDIVGLTRMPGNRFQYPDTLAVSPEFCEIYVLSDANIFRVKNAAAVSVDTTFSREQLVVFNVAFEASDIDRVTTIPVSSGLIDQGDVLTPSPTQMVLNNRLYNNVIQIGTSFQQTLAWRDDRSLHDLGTVYSPTKATLTDASVTATIATTLNNANRTSDEPFISDLRVQQSGLLYSLDDVRVLKRFTPGQVFREDFDISLTEQSKNIIVDYGGLII